MRRLAFASLLPLLLLTALGVLPLPASAGVNRWTTGGPYGGDVGVLVVDPDSPATLYAGTDGGGVFKSTDGAGSWTAASRGMGAQDVLAIVFDPEDPKVLYAAVGAAGVFKSTDGAGRWEAANRGFGEEAVVQALAIDPVTPATLYAGTGDGGVLKSTDGGDRWRGANVGLPAGTARDVRGLAVDPAAPATLYAATGAGIFKSTDGGASWSAAGSIEGRSADQVVIDPEAPATLYAVSLGTTTRLYKSTNGGASFTPIVFEGSSFLRSIALDPNDSSTIYAATGSNRNVYKSTNGGASWSAGSSGITSLIVRCVAVAPGSPGTVYTGTHFDGGVFKSTDGGSNFAAASQGLSGGHVLAVAVRADADVLFAGTEAGISRSQDGGLSWQELPLPGLLFGGGVESLAVDPVNVLTVFAGTANGILRSQDGGDSWAVVANAFTVPGSVEALAVDPTNPQRVYAGTGGGLLRSLDGGDTWEDATTGLPTDIVLDVTVAADGTVYVLTTNFGLNGRVSRSTNAGATWQRADTGLPGGFLFSLAAAPTDASVLYAGGFGGIYRSQNGGAGWQDAGGDLALQLATDLVVDPAKASTVYLAGFDGVYKSVDGGRQWFPVGDEVPAVAASLALGPSEPGRLHAGTLGRSVFDLEQVFGCTPGESTLCIDDEAGDRRFRVGLTFDTSQGGGQSGEAGTVPLAPLGIARGGVLSFGDPANPELLVKVLDGCAINGRYWVFSAATTNVGFRLSVTDNASGVQRVYDNLDRMTAETVTDVRAFETCGGNGLIPRESATSALRDERRAALHEAVAANLTGLDPRAGKSRLLRAGLEGLAEAANSRPAAASSSWDSWESAGTKGLGGCTADAETLCVDDAAGDGRFRITATYDTVLGGGQSGDGRATSLVPLGVGKGGIFSFTDPNNPEVLIKVLDGCAITGHFWVFAAATTTVGFELRVEDTRAGVERVFVNPDETAAVPLLETRALDTCDL